MMWFLLHDILPVDGDKTYLKVSNYMEIKRNILMNIKLVRST